MKSTCTYSTITLPGTLPGRDNPYPNLTYDQTPKTEATDEIKRELRLDYGAVSTALPYPMQDDYGRDRSPVALKTAVLENTYLKAVFLPEYGARLWSLYDKRRGRDLLYQNGVFQPANLAVRNAWFAGGVEWNIGFRGHSPLTMDRMFCEELVDEELKIPVLRFYEWERVRQTAFEICAYLPDDSENLMIRVKLKNCTNSEIPMYWWSNIAVPETIDTRVIVPSVSAYTNVYLGQMTKSAVPYCNRTDITYSATQMDSKDYFFSIRPEDRKWIAAVDRDGFGLLQTSTDRLKARKLFLWGMRRCYRNWQNLLAEPLKPYIEIQAGLAPTQMECIPMPAGAEWDWLESYGPVQVDPDRAHHQNWDTAVSCVQAYAEKFVSRSWMNRELARVNSGVWTRRETRLIGSGWGALESLRRKYNGEDRLPAGLLFPEASIGEEQAIWLELLTDGVFPSPQGAEPVPVSFMRQEEWLELLRRYIAEHMDNWFAWYTLGIGRFAQDRAEEAKRCFLEAAKLSKNTYTLRALALMLEEEDPGRAASLMTEAFLRQSGDYHLAKDTLALLARLNKPDQMASLWEKLPQTLKDRGRIKLYELSAAIQLKDIQRCERILSVPFTVDDLREGEALFANLWYEYCYLKMELDGIETEDKKSYAIAHYEMPVWLDYLYI